MLIATDCLARQRRNEATDDGWNMEHGILSWTTSMENPSVDELIHTDEEVDEI